MALPLVNSHNQKLTCKSRQNFTMLHQCYVVQFLQYCIIFAVLHCVLTDVCQISVKAAKAEKIMAARNSMAHHS